MHLIVKNPTMLPIEPMFEDFSIWVQLIEDGICIFLLAGSEDNNFEFPAHLPQEGECIGSNVYPKFMNPILIPLQSNAKFEVTVGFIVVHTMDEGFVQIQNECFPFGGVVSGLEIEPLVGHISHSGNLILLAFSNYLDGSTNVLHDQRVFLIYSSLCLTHIVRIMPSWRIGVRVWRLKVFGLRRFCHKGCKFVIFLLYCDARIILAKPRIEIT